MIPFINREVEVAAIEELVAASDTFHVICINAQGGIGKTRLLQELYARYSRSNQSNLFICPIIDFDERALHIPHALASHIARALGSQKFSNYFDALDDWHKMEQNNVTLERLKRVEVEIYKTFTEDFTSISSERRVLLLFDTTDALMRIDDMLDFILNTDLRNCVIVIAGRNAEDIAKHLQGSRPNCVHLINLKEFSPDASADYLKKKQAALGVSIELDLAEKLTYLAQGRPILLDLAVDLRARGISLDWLRSTDLQTLRTLSPDEQRVCFKEFEAHLVWHITETHRDTDWLFLLMARVYPLDAASIAEFQAISLEEAETLIASVREYVFIKNLAHGRISLHDEMRRMINTHVWPKVDPEGKHQCYDSSRAVIYLQREIARAELLLSTIRVKPKLPSSRILSPGQREPLEHELWVLREQMLYHGLVEDVGKGVELFIVLFDTPLQPYRATFHKTILSLIEPFKEHLNNEQRFAINIRHARHLIFDSSYYDQAKTILSSYVECLPVQPEQQIEIMRLWGNLQIRTGKLDEAIDSLTKAVEISREYGLHDALISAETALGWGYRHISEWEQAENHYAQAIQLYFTRNKPVDELFVLLHNNLALVGGYLQKRGSLTLAEQAVIYAQSLADPHLLGQTYSAHGCVLYQFGSLDKASVEFRHALDIFEETQAEEQMSWVYSWQGVVLWAKSVSSDGLSAKMRKDLLNEAEELFLRSLRLKFITHQPMTLDRLGRVYVERGAYDKARDAWQNCLETGRKIHDALYELCGIRDLANLAVMEHRFEEFQHFDSLMKEYQERWPKPFTHTWAGACLYIGLLALGAGVIDQAEFYIIKGIKLVNEYGQYGVQDIGYYLKKITPIVIAIAPLALRARLAETLKACWLDSEAKLFKNHPEAFKFFNDWAQA